MKSKYAAITACIILFVTGRANCQLQPDSLEINQTKLRTVLITESSFAVGSLLLLNQLWYKDYPKSAFHLFNDNNEWLQMDKIGHITTSLSIGSFCYKTLTWAGVENRKAIWYGGCMGSAYLFAIEMFDGFSSEWGFSVGDFAANTIGTGIFIGQQLAWNEQRVKVKWSYHNTNLPQYRPNVLGENLAQRTLKDYNGQTYWISANLRSFFPSAQRIPTWLNIAAGYGAEGMLGADENPTDLPYFDRYRQCYFSLDVDVKRIPTKSRFLKTVFYFVDFLKFPAPALEFSGHDKIKFHPLYF